MDSINRFLDKIPPIFQAILLLIVAFLIAWVAKAIVVAIMKRLNVDEKLGTKGVQDTSTGTTSAFVGKLTFLIVFLLFLPAVLDKLNMGSVSDPITGMINSIFHYLPNIIAAALILFIGHMIAKLVGQLVEAVARRANVDRVQTQLGMVVTEQNSLAGLIGKILYALIMVFVVIAGLQALAIRAISEPAVAMLHQVLDYLPLLVMGLVLIGIGVFAAKLLGKLVTSILTGIGADTWLGKLLPQRANADGDATVTAPSFSVSKAIGIVVQVVVILFFIVEGLQVLQLEVLTDIGAAIIGYLPSALAAAVIMVLAVLGANWVESLIVRRSPANRSYAVAAKVAILVIAAFMTLTQLHLSQQIVTIAFLATVSALAIAFAIAFGVGGRGFAASRLQKLEHKLDEPDTTVEHSAPGPEHRA